MTETKNQLQRNLAMHFGVLIIFLIMLIVNSEVALAQDPSIPPEVRNAMENALLRESDLPQYHAFNWEAEKKCPRRELATNLMGGY
jgi:hypothetical protein